MKKNNRIRRVLMEGPSTCAEVALALGISKREAHAGLWVLQLQGEAEIVGKVNGSRTPPRNIYALTRRGVTAYPLRIERDKLK